jgi:hypothetical protein
VAKSNTKPKELTAAEQLAELSRLRPAAAAALLGIAPRTLRDRLDLPRADGGRYDARELFAAARGRVDRPRLSDDERELIYQIADALTDPGLYNGPGLPAYRAAQRLVAQHGEGVLLVLVDRLGWLFQDAARYAGDCEPQPLRPVVCDYCGKVRRGEKWHKAPKPTDCVYGCCPDCETSKAPVPDVFASGRRWDEEDA